MSANINRTGPNAPRYCPHYTHDWRPYLMDYNEYQRKANHARGIENCPDAKEGKN